MGVDFFNFCTGFFTALLPMSGFGYDLLLYYIYTKCYPIVTKINVWV